MRYPCRCVNCWARRTLLRHPDTYVKPRRCAFCGDNRWWVDKFRIAARTDPKKRARDRGKLCYKDCLPYVHPTNTKQCCQYEDWLIESTINGRRDRLDSGDTMPF